jgi:hypothetical protein
VESERWSLEKVVKVTAGYMRQKEELAFHKALAAAGM